MSAASPPTRLPTSEAAERNKGPILDAIAPYLSPGPRRVLEIGSGTAQHAVHVAAALPAIEWQTSDLVENHAAISARIEASGLANVRPPVALDARLDDWPVAPPFDAVFSANTAHIMDLEAVEGLFRGAGRVLAAGGVLLLYGPFSDGGQHNAPSNARFDAALRAQDPRMGVRDLHELRRFAEAAGLGLEADRAMPANNRVLIWRRAC